MPTSSKRVQVLLKPRVTEIIEQISEEENLSLSKICSLLIEEALITRGAFSKTSTIREVLPPTPERDSLMKRDSLAIAAAEAAEKAGRQHETVMKKTEPMDGDEETLRLLKKFKALQDAGLL